VAEIVLKVGSVSADEKTPQDGDVVFAAGSRLIKQCHAMHIAKPTAFNTDGLRIPDTASEWYLERTRQYKFEAVSKTEVLRTDLRLMTSETISNVPNAQGEVIKLDAYLKNRLSASNHLIFGTPGNEVWYGGKRLVSHADLDQVWLKYLNALGEDESNYRLWPLTPIEKKHFLSVKSDDFDDATEGDYPDALWEYEQINDDDELWTMVYRHKHRIDIDADLGLTAKERADIRDKEKEIDVRDKGEIDRTTVVELKQKRVAVGR
jgi:hypothetical protein